MKALLMGCALASAMAVACSDVRVVDDDGDGSDDGSGGAVSGLGGGGGAPASGSPEARLFTTWYSEDQRGFQAWDEPDQRGIDREPDARVVMSDAAKAFGVAGGKLLVLDSHETLRVFDDVWSLDSSAEPQHVIKLDAAPTDWDRLRVISDLDLVSVLGLVFLQASQISQASAPLSVGWHEPVYDPIGDRLFVLAGGAVRVVDNASISATLEPSWTLYQVEDRPVTHLISDGESLFGSALDPDAQFGSSTQVLVWPLTVTGPSTPADLGYGPPGAIRALAALPTGGVAALADSSLWAWDAAAPTFPEASWDSFAATDGCLTVSTTGRIYACADYHILVYADASLGTPVDSGVGENDLLLIER